MYNIQQLVSGYVCACMRLIRLNLLILFLMRYVLTSLKCGSRVGSRKPHVLEITTITRLIMITDGICINSSNEPLFFSTLQAIN